MLIDPLTFSVHIIYYLIDRCEMYIYTYGELSGRGRVGSGRNSGASADKLIVEEIWCFGRYTESEGYSLYFSLFRGI